ncbi:hypothetical protein T492DRAFT_1011988 [Pavlovales sp. CCMP2436]|nr:hypothetical protein T492DRAFT_1011988 [Pavlovales sp. CCMP2436]
MGDSAEGATGASAAGTAPEGPPSSSLAARKARRAATRQTAAKNEAATVMQSFWRGKQGRGDAAGLAQAKASKKGDAATSVAAAAGGSDAPRGGGAKAATKGGAATPVAAAAGGSGAPRGGGAKSGCGAGGATSEQHIVVDMGPADAGATADAAVVGGEGADGKGGALRRRTPQQRAEVYVLAAAEGAPAGARDRLRAAAPCIGKCWMGCAIAGVYMAKGVVLVSSLLHAAPVKVLNLIYGVILCFFGGPFAVSFAAIECFRAMGWQELVAEATVLADAWRDSGVADAGDNQTDVDGNGEADVDQLSPKQLLARKVGVFFGSVTEPARVQKAVGLLLRAWYGALAVLVIKFARAVALALGVARMATPPLVWLLGGPLSRVLGPKHAQWGPVILQTVAQGVATILAWTLERGISAWYSGMHGGLLAARMAMELLADMGTSESAPAFVKAIASKVGGPDGTLADEAIGYALGVGGFICQLASGFTLTFPLSLLLFPLLTIEYGLTWQLTWLT